MRNRTFAQLDLFLAQHVVESMIFSTNITTLHHVVIFIISIIINS
jgi:hypothetical protein